MIACLCRRLRDQDVEAALTAGARSYEAVHQHHGTTPCCGRCRPHIDGQIAAAPKAFAKG